MIDIILLWLGIGVGYAVAGAMIAGGLYLVFVLGTNPVNPLGKTFRFAGFVLIGSGLVLGAASYGKSIGAASEAAAWKAKNYEAEIARLRLESAGRQLAAATSAAAAAKLTSENDDAQRKIAEYQAALGAGAACRLPTSDDDRRLCDIIGRSAAGCKPAR